MAADEHHGSGEGVTNQPLSRDHTIATWEPIEDERASALPKNTLNGQSPGSASSGSSPPLSPSSFGASSFHTANSFEGNEGEQDNGKVEDGLGALAVTSSEVKKHGRKISITPSLSLDTSGANEGSPIVNPGAWRSPLSPQPVDKASSTSAGSLPSQSPISPRTRERGFSLRRSLLARKFHEPLEGNSTVMEMQPAGPSASQATSTQLDSNDTTAKNPAATITVSPVTQHPNETHEDSKTLKEAYALSALPHYETWVANKLTETGILAQLRSVRERLRKKILRVQEKPPSKDGRHLDLGFNHKTPLIDDRTGHEFVNNTILSTRYTLYNFLPRQLFAQFSKLANFYFLCVSILQMIPGLSTTGTYTTIVPLLFFVTISIAKEGYDDLRRYRLDKAENNRVASVLHNIEPNEAGSDQNNSRFSISEGPESWAKTKWYGVRVGDVVRLNRDDAVPADIIVLQASGTEGIAYVETMALDGETSLKSRQAPPLLAKKCRITGDRLKCTAHFVVEDPNLNLYEFEGKVNIEDEVLPLTNNDVIYRGSVIRNTTEVIGMVIYTGEECKIRMNATKNPRIKAVSS